MVVLYHSILFLTVIVFFVNCLTEERDVIISLKNFCFGPSIRSIFKKILKTVDDMFRYLILSNFMGIKVGVI
jgi:hypothetical protein